MDLTAITRCDSTARLTEVYEAWVEAEGLDLLPALELREELADRAETLRCQQIWITQFLARWDEVEDDEATARALRDDRRT